MGTRIFPFFAGKKGDFMPRDWDSSTMGLRFEQGKHSDDGICSVGRWDLVKISAGRWDKDPPSGPHTSNFWEILCAKGFFSERNLSDA